MGGKLRPALGGRGDGPNAIGKKRQGPLHGDVRIKLAHRPGGRIARIGKALGPGGLLLGVEALKIGAAHVHLAPHFQHGRSTGGQLQGNLPNGADVVRDIFAHLAIAARGRLHQAAGFVAQAHGQAVELGFGHVLDGRV